MTQDAAPLIRTHSHEAPFQEIVTPLSARALFWRPRYLHSSAVLHHLPFLFWLADMLRPQTAVALGVGDGVGYFGLCQAIDRLGAAARCHGLEGCGPEPDGTDPMVAAYNAAHYADFSQLHPGDPREAVHRFENGSVDLLLIDCDPDEGLIQSLTHDWPRKLSDRAVIVLHGTAGRFASGPGQAFWQSLTRTCPTVQFAAGAGLAAVLYGPDRLDRLERLAALSLGQTGYAGVHHVFARLGAANVHEQAALAEAVRAGAALEQATAADRSLRELRQVLQLREVALESVSGAEAVRADQLAAVQARLFDLQTAHDARAEQIASHARALAEVDAAAIREAASRDSALIRERDRAEAMAARLSVAEAAAQTARAEAARLTAQLAEAGTVAAAQLAVKDRALALATERLEAARAAEAEALQLRDAAQAAVEAARVEAAAQEAARAEVASTSDSAAEATHAEEIRALTLRLEATQQEVLTLQRELRARADQARQMQDLERELEAAQQHVADLMASTSWRVTGPLRGVSRLVRRRG